MDYKQFFVDAFKHNLISELNIDNDFFIPFGSEKRYSCSVAMAVAAKLQADFPDIGFSLTDADLEFSKSLGVDKLHPDQMPFGVSLEMPIFMAFFSDFFRRPDVGILPPGEDIHKNVIAFFVKYRIPSDLLAEIPVGSSLAEKLSDGGLFDTPLPGGLQTTRQAMADAFQSIELCALRAQKKQVDAALTEYQTSSETMAKRRARLARSVGAKRTKDETLIFKEYVFSVLELHSERLCICTGNDSPPTLDISRKTKLSAFQIILKRYRQTPDGLASLLKRQHAKVPALKNFLTDFTR